MIALLSRKKDNRTCEKEKDCFFTERLTDLRVDGMYKAFESRKCSKSKHFKTKIRLKYLT